MKLPRDVDSERLIKALSVLGYQVTRKKGSHIQLTTDRDGENHEVILSHHPIKTGTLAGILKHVAQHHGMSLDDLLKLLRL